MLKINMISKTFDRGSVNEKKALHQVSLSLDEGEFVTVIGGNGAGKSTLLNCISGVHPVDEGSIILDGTDITFSPEYKRSRLIGRVFQNPLLGTAFDMTIAENLAIAWARGKPHGLSPGTVSYTHLDVYKRQVSTAATPALSGEGCDGTLQRGCNRAIGHQSRWYRRQRACPCKGRLF